MAVNVLIYVQHVAAQSGRDELNMYSSVHSWVLIVKLTNILHTVSGCKLDTTSS